MTIELRADAGFAKPEIYAYCERERIAYTIGLVHQCPPGSAWPRRWSPRRWRSRRPRTGRRSGCWTRRPTRPTPGPRARRVIIKAEALAKGTNTRFVVTTRTDPPEALYAWYTDRGETENWIKDLKAGLLRRPPLLPPLPGQSGAAAAARGGLLAARHPAPLVGAGGNGAACSWRRCACA